MVYIWRSARKRVMLSRLAPSDEKSTELGTAFSSTSMPARAQACLITTWVFCRMAVLVVWNTNRRRRPSRARTPSEPRAHPAVSRTPLAFSTSNSQRVFGDTKAGGPFRRLAVARPRRP